MPQSDTYLYGSGSRHLENAEPVADGSVPVSVELDPTKRSFLMPIAYLPAVAVMAIAWASSSQQMTDLGFLLITIVAVLQVVNELWRFPQRFGIGGLVAFGG